MHITLTIYSTAQCFLVIEWSLMTTKNLHVNHLFLRVMESYKRMREPKLKVVDSNGTPDEVLQAVIDLLKSERLVNGSKYWSPGRTWGSPSLDFVNNITINSSTVVCLVQKTTSLIRTLCYIERKLLLAWTFYYKHFKPRNCFTCNIFVYTCRQYCSYTTILSNNRNILCCTWNEFTVHMGVTFVLTVLNMVATLHRAILWRCTRDGWIYII